jgi:DNA invertase Pin-like site-specific DNA recombinase
MNEELRSGDTLVVLAFDRAFRSVIDGLIALDDLTDKGIILESTSQRFDPTTPDGRLFFKLTMAVGEWEVNNLAVRTVQGLRAAVKRGKKLGRPTGS